MAFKHLGVGAVLAVSFGRIFYRNALNFGLPALFFPAAGEIGRWRPARGRAGDGLHRQLAPAHASTGSTGFRSISWTWSSAGGLMPYLKKPL